MRIRNDDLKAPEPRFSELIIDNPKTYADSLRSLEARLFPYYAGYSSSFAVHLLRSLSLPSEAVVFDPWNGSGTTTSAAAQLGYHALGQDLNPVMVLVAKAALLPRSEASSLVPLAKSIIATSRQMTGEGLADDPLETWIMPQNTGFIRRIEAQINRSLASYTHYVKLTNASALSNLSSLAAFFYVALFRATRRLLADFIPTNPTWIKTPETLRHRRRPTEQTVCNAFLAEVVSLSMRLSTITEDLKTDRRAVITLGNAESVSLPSHSVDAIVASPPYCTRIDYAVATSVELAVLRCSSNDFDGMRRSLMGTSTVPGHPLPVSKTWGGTCLSFLEKLHDHPSKASSTYYFKNHVQYFNSLKTSINELARVLRSQGTCTLVVQDSYYKELHNDVAGMTVEMAEDAGFYLGARKDFASNRSMAVINIRASKYVTKRITTETILCFSKA